MKKKEANPQLDYLMGGPPPWKRKRNWKWNDEVDMINKHYPRERVIICEAGKAPVIIPAAGEDETEK